MRLDFSKISSEFEVRTHIDSKLGEVVLITPGFDKHSWYPSELHYRSLLCYPDGTVISAGFPKFFNYGEMPKLDRKTYQAIQNGKVWFTEKMDGSLLIRSVIGGKVHLRTRGSSGMLDSFSEPILKLIQERFQNLMNPNFDSEYSLLFEYTGPENKIVLEYQNPDLTALGKVSLESLQFISSPKIVSEMEEIYNTPAVKFHNLGQDFEELSNQVQGWEDSEGIVVWCPQDDGSLHLSKIKTQKYRLLHALKFQLSSQKIEQFCWYEKISSLEELKERFFALGLDWELVSFVQPTFEDYLQRLNEIRADVNSLIQEIDKEDIKSLPSRKSKANALKVLANHNKFLFNVGIEYLFGDGNLDKLIGAKTLGVSTRSVLNMSKPELLGSRSYDESRNGEGTCTEN